MCAFLVLLFLGPRAFLLVWWLVEPARWAVTFDTFLLPLLGFLVLPWTTLVYALAAPVDGIVGWDWLLMALGVLADLSSYAGGAVGSRGRVPGYRS